MSSTYTTSSLQRPSARFVRLAQLRKLLACEKVAAVCYRLRGNDIDFLLVRTRGSKRWTFPKGSAEPGLTHAQAAALEAFEEAGVHGCIEEACFARYVRRDEEGRFGKSAASLAVHAHLCEVLRLANPKEAKRNRTWFAAGDARQCLREGRGAHDAAQLVRVIDSAVARIQKLRSGAGASGSIPREDRISPNLRRPEIAHKDGLHNVPFDFAEAYGRAQQIALMPYGRRPLAGAPAFAAENRGRQTLPCEVLEFDPPKTFKLPAWSGRKVKG